MISYGAFLVYNTNCLLQIDEGDYNPKKTLYITVKVI